VRVTLAESALEDLQDILEWHAEQGVPETGERLVDALLLKIEHLQQYPDMGRMVPEFSQPWLREIIHSPYRIVYRRDVECVRIVRILRAERLLRLPGDDD